MKKFWRDLVRGVVKDWRNWRQFLAHIIQGLLLGAAAILPGFSGSVMAISFGVYDNFIEIAAHPLQRLSHNIRFLLPYGIGAILGWILVSLVLVKLFAHESGQVLTIYAFLGLMLGSMPALFKEANSGPKGFRKSYLGPMVGAILLSLAVGWFLENRAGGQISLQLNWWVDLISGGLIGLGVVLPGLSASVLLIFMGVYNALMAAVTTLDLGTIALVGIGMLITIVAWSKLIAWLLKRYYGVTYYIFIGLTFGSMFLIWPKFPSGGNGWLAILLFLGGVVGGYYLNNLQNMGRTQKNV